MDVQKKYQATSIQVNYMSEALPGDTLILYKYAGAIEMGHIYISGINEQNGNGIFRAQIQISGIPE